ncbi:MULTISPECIES: phosphodiester glycosidase family protein [Dolichospermum]|uniref:Phosphodiester glycosidase family protein n=1 Tax=Dolichospermum heterosporum TAC447 TaxID=747523 RepID=A0ABY5LZ74_9CYAN|nr:MULTISPECIES: phosphodiester glycosidase family protein [Dolichospermum]MBE9257443.1 phosphodiester glycosidase family protein [Dolichospermum sp. LEGE 00246]MDK2409039.1 phosphodiester glycosidase family protein [Aphanizomenon sp. 202]MDK2457837.1 phosphodiester glycosidase family protein [Aphanizomenon sp. PH219]UUO17333.1 phosphodiester glycosidase family protein [Dolichospermum heterosporum TAC447]
MTISKISRRSFLFLGGATLAQGLTLTLPSYAQPVQVNKSQINGIPFYQTIVDLTDPKTLMTMGLAKNASFANTIQKTSGDEEFSKLVARYKAAVVANGTFFAKNPQKTVLGNMVAGGRFVKYSRWENFGTTLGLGVGNKPEMVTARVDGKPEWNKHWFSLTCGPRLLRQGEIWINPSIEGFKDPVVLGNSDRTAIGFTQDGTKLILANFEINLSLQQEAEAMKAIGCYEAMNLDGGASRALANKTNIVVPAGRPLTNVIVIYDATNPAPTALEQAWLKFQKGERPPIPAS